MMKKIIKGKTYGEERALYNIKDTIVKECYFDGIEDGESALKECNNIDIIDCYMNLRYPIWHNHNTSIYNCQFTNNCRAPLWYCQTLLLEKSKIEGVKTLRECSQVTINSCDIISSEFGWKCSDLKISNTFLDSEYAFFESQNIDVNKISLKGKYSFQYVSNLKINNSTLITKDAFWHSNHVIISDSIIEGEYLGWYSNDITFIRCHIKGTQPLCYCKKLKLIDCTMEETDFSFEYSEVDATINNKILSIKNPLKGTIVARDYGEIIIENSIYPVEAIIKKK